MWLSSSTCFFRSGTIENSYLLSAVKNRHVIGKRKTKTNALHGRIYIYTHTHTHTNAQKGTYTYVYVYVYTYTYVYVYVHKHICIRVCIYISCYQSEPELVLQASAGNRK